MPQSLKPTRRRPHFRHHPHRARSQATRNFRTPEYGRSYSRRPSRGGR